MAATEQQLAAAMAARGTAETQGGAESRRLAADLADVQAKLDETLAQLVASRRETEEIRAEAQAVQGRSTVEVGRLQNQLADVTRQLESIRGENAALQQRLSESAATKPATDSTEFTQTIADPPPPAPDRRPAWRGRSGTQSRATAASRMSRRTPAWS